MIIEETMRLATLNKFVSNDDAPISSVEWTNLQTNLLRRINVLQCIGNTNTRNVYMCCAFYPILLFDRTLLNNLPGIS